MIFFSDPNCTVALSNWTIGGNCTSSLHPGHPFPTAPIPLGNLALGSNGTHGKVIFGGSRHSCNTECRVNASGILPVAKLGVCWGVDDNNVPQDGRPLYFVLVVDRVPS